MTDLHGMIALVTGASSGIGEGTARQLAKAGVTVGLVARRKDRLETLKASIEADGGTARVFVADVTNVAELKDAAQALRDEFGSVDVLFNNAGIMPISDIDEFKTDEWDQMVDINIKGVLNGIAAVLPIMIEQHSGHIFNISSIAGRRVFGQGFSVYSATKFAVSALSEGLRMEVGGKHNIRVTTIDPGQVSTELLEGTSNEELKATIREAGADVKMVQPSELGEAVVFALQAPEHVNLANLFILPTSQA
ncbi:SDR family oxidoreductase [Herbiconiux daphne]|uniref:SDR family oxidoreductase n=1 Tax=Herbiconiux daphne TaxID=2970914 RepID=A0ABT2H6W7_9MICO|nr:SDR family oxidoreductase [Herbiconiux daphne]MCS5735706.1 SDR family oxidoreductase [Herbiconiux daphne]